MPSMEKLNIDCGLNSSILLMANILILIMIVWLCKRIFIFKEMHDKVFRGKRGWNLQLPYNSKKQVCMLKGEENKI